MLCPEQTIAIELSCVSQEVTYRSVAVNLVQRQPNHLISQALFLPDLTETALPFQKEQTSEKELRIEFDSAFSHPMLKNDKRGCQE